MSKMSQFKSTRAVLIILGTLVLAYTPACSTADKPQADFTSVGRGAAVTPSIPWETWRNPADIEAMPPPEIKDYPKQQDDG